MLRLWLLTALLLRLDACWKNTSKCFSPSPLLLLSFASILLLLPLLRRDIHFCFLVEVLLLLIIFLVGCAAAAAGACAAYNISTQAGVGTVSCFFLRFCRWHCDASDVYRCRCSWLLLFLPFRLRYFGYGCWLRCCWDGMHAGKIQNGCTPAVLQQKGIYTYLVRIQNFLLHFPFDEIYRRLLFSLSGILFSRE